MINISKIYNIYFKNNKRIKWNQTNSFLRETRMQQKFLLELDEDVSMNKSEHQPPEFRQRGQQH